MCTDLQTSGISRRTVNDVITGALALTPRPHDARPQVTGTGHAARTRRHLENELRIVHFGVHAVTGGPTLLVLTTAADTQDAAASETKKNGINNRKFA